MEPNQTRRTCSTSIAALPLGNLAGFELHEVVGEPGLMAKISIMKHYYRSGSVQPLKKAAKVKALKLSPLEQKQVLNEMDKNRHA